jgi:hypothetical protein
MATFRVAKSLFYVVRNIGCSNARFLHAATEFRYLSGTLVDESLWLG